MTISERNNLVMRNRGLVHRLVGKTNSNCMERDELAQYGYLGLIKAVENFDSKYGLAFSTYAVPYIKSYIRWGLFENMGVVGGIKAKKKKMVESISLNERVSSKCEVQDCLLDSAFQENMSTIDDSIYIEKLVSILSGRDREIIEYRYGLKDGVERTFRETGIKFNMSKQRVEQIEKKILNRMRGDT